MEAGQHLTVAQIIERLRKEGLELNKRTFQYYVQAGLLPKGLRKGASTGGVRFYYAESVVDDLRRIFALKGKGYRLNDIKRELGLYAAVRRRAQAPTDELLSAPSTLPIIDQRFSSSTKAGDRDLLGRVIHLTPDGHTLTSCLQCGTCGGSCPSADDMEHTPRALLALLLAGEDERVLASNTPWFCVSCYHCMVRCPQKIPITEIMYSLKELAGRAGVARITDAHDYARIFVSLVEKYGRSFDMGLIFRYHFTHHPISRLTWGALALKLYRSERVISSPSRIKNIDQLDKILAAARTIGEEE